RELQRRLPERQVDDLVGVAAESQGRSLPIQARLDRPHVARPPSMRGKDLRAFFFDQYVDIRYAARRWRKRARKLQLLIQRVERALGAKLDPVPRAQRPREREASNRLAAVLDDVLVKITVERADAIEEKIVLETLIAATIDEADNAERPRPDIAIIVGAELVAFAPFPVVLNERAIRIVERVEEVKVVVRVETPSVDLRVGAEAAAPEREGDAAVDGGFAEIPRRGRFGTARIDVARLIGEQ